MVPKVPSNQQITIPRLDAISKNCNWKTLAFSNAQYAFHIKKKTKLVFFKNALVV
jgi:hypothetical protein